jgi:3-isopropylmalate/(R)-2-methylmalate dehydratase small subunit
VKIDLASQTVTLPDGRKVEFPIDPFSKHCLLEGVDELGYILKQARSWTRRSRSSVNNSISKTG